MGNKGETFKKEAAETAELMQIKLAGINNLSFRKMFGGYGLFSNDKMFGLIDSKGQCFLKADSTNLKDFEAFHSDKHSKMPYYSIPSHVLQDRQLLESMVIKSIEINKDS